MQLPQAVQNLFPELFQAHPRSSALSELTPRKTNKEIAPIVALAVCQKEVAQNSRLAAGLWLYADDLEAAHQIVQHLPDDTASFWHAIIHRREADYTNAQYWLHQARNHPLIPQLNPNKLLTLAQNQDPIATSLQRQEWATLMLYTLQNP